MTWHTTIFVCTVFGSAAVLLDLIAYKSKIIVLWFFVQCIMEFIMFMNFSKGTPIINFNIPSFRHKKKTLYKRHHLYNSRYSARCKSTGSVSIRWDTCLFNLPFRPVIRLQTTPNFNILSTPCLRSKIQVKLSPLSCTIMSSTLWLRIKHALQLYLADMLGYIGHYYIIDTNGNLTILAPLVCTGQGTFLDT